MITPALVSALWLVIAILLVGGGALWLGSEIVWRVDRGRGL